MRALPSPPVQTSRNPIPNDRYNLNIITTITTFWSACLLLPVWPPIPSAVSSSFCLSSTFSNETINQSRTAWKLFTETELHRSKELFSPVSKLSAHLTSASHNTEPEAMQWLPDKLKFTDDEAKAMLHDICAGASNTHPREKSPCLCSSPTTFTTLKEAPCQPEKSLTYQKQLYNICDRPNIGQMWLCRKYELYCIEAISIELCHRSWTLEALNQ